jgi:hypothetical protein
MFDTNGAIDDYNPGDINANTASQWASLQFANRVQDLPELTTKKAADGTLVARGPCSGPEEQFRTIDGTCNDLKNPLMGAKLTRFGRNVSFDAARKYDDQPDPKRIAAELMYRPAPAAPGSRAEREENQRGDGESDRARGGRTFVGGFIRVHEFWMVGRGKIRSGQGPSR